MFLQKIKAINFRNFDNLFLELDPKKPMNIIYSQNGMGKSNLLEIIYYLSYFRSFRNVLDKELINKNFNAFYIECDFLINSLSNNLKIKYKDKKEIRFNNKKCNKFSDFFGKLLTVFFGNEDIFIINGPPLIRRNFFDIYFSIFDRKYLFYLKKFKHLLKIKNFLLKTKKDKNLLSVYNEQLSNIILYIQKVRSSMIDSINKAFKDKFKNIGNFNEKVKILYRPSIKF